MSFAELLKNFQRLSAEGLIPNKIPQYSDVSNRLFMIAYDNRPNILTSSSSNSNITFPLSYMDALCIINRMFNIIDIPEDELDNYLVAAFYVSRFIHSDTSVVKDIDHAAIVKYIDHIVTVLDGKLYYPGTVTVMDLLLDGLSNNVLYIAAVFGLSPYFLMYTQDSIAAAIIFLSDPKIEVPGYDRDESKQLTHIIYQEVVKLYNTLPLDYKIEIKRTYKKILNYEYDPDLIIEQIGSEFQKVNVHNSSRLIIPKKLTSVGKGGFGDVYSAVVDKHKVAIKKQPIANIKSAVIEIVVMKSMKHPNIQTIRSFSMEDDHITFSMTLQVTSLNKIMSTITDIALKRKIGRGIIEGVKYLHSMGIIHVDIKPENILMSAANIPKISDFGSSRILTVGYQHMSMGTLIYTPYDILQTVFTSRQMHFIADFSYDVWSTGVTLLELETGKHVLFTQMYNNVYDSIASTINKIHNVVIKDKLSIITDRDLRLVLRQMLNIDPELRITMKQVTI